VSIEPDQKLDFGNVLIRPQPGTLSSRRDVDIKRAFTFPHSDKTWNGFPIVASNMDNTGTFRMAKALSGHDAMTALSKYYDSNDITKFFQRQESENAFYSMGIGADELQKFAKAKALKYQFRKSASRLPTAIFLT
jgi:GMP reductase